MGQGKFTGTLAAFGLIAAMGMSGAEAADPLKVGFVYVGPIGDHGWTYRHNVGRLAIERAFGDKVKTSFVESVSEGADAERVIRTLAASGHKLIFTTSFGYMNPTVKVAKMFPDVKFEHATGYKRGKNVSTYAARFYEGRSIAGVIAANMTKTNVIGYVGSFPIPEVVRGINAFTISLRKIKPKAIVKVVWVSTWYDPGKEGDAAKALLDQGADVILQHTDSPAPLQIAQKRNKWAVGQASDMTKFGSKSHLTAIVDVWDEYYVSRTKAVMDGTWKSQDVWKGLKAGMLTMAPYNKAIPAGAVAKAKQMEADIKAGKFHSFQGPINNQAGKLVVPAGQRVSDKDLLSMNWYVEGVQGKLPK
jgi:basic membrane protein A and related proteins